MGRMVGYLVGALDIHDIVLIGLMTEFGDPWLDAVRAGGTTERPAAAGGRDTHRARQSRLGRGGAGRGGAADDGRARPEPGGMTMLTDPMVVATLMSAAADVATPPIGVVAGHRHRRHQDGRPGRGRRRPRPGSGGTTHRPARAGAGGGRGRAGGAGGGGRRRTGTLRAVGVVVPGDVDPRTGIVRLAVNLDARDLPLGRVAGTGARRALLRGPRCARGGRVARCPPGCDRGPGLPEHRHGHRGGRRARRADPRRRQRPRGRDRPLCRRPGRARRAPAACAAAWRSSRPARPWRAPPPRRSTPARPPCCASGRPTTPITAAEVYAAADQGDALALRVTDVAAAAIARAVRSLVLSYGVATVVVGGGPSRAGGAFTRPLMDHLADERSASALVRRAFLGTVEVLPPDAQPTAWGAITVARIGLQQTHTTDDERREARLDET